jgi:hypothetical protein
MKATRFARTLACFAAALLAANLAWAEPSQSDNAAPTTSGEHAGKVLVTFNQLPASGDYEIIGPISVFKRWFGGTGASMQLLGQKARELGANAVVESRVWLAPAFPAQVAPHGSGIAVRIRDIKILEALVDEASSWE